METYHETHSSQGIVSHEFNAKTTWIPWPQQVVIYHECHIGKM